MKKATSFLLALLLMLMTPLAVAAQEAAAPILRVGYLESEPYGEFAAELNAMARELARMEILDSRLTLLPIDDATVLWQTLSAAEKGKVDFVSEACYTLSEMDEQQQAAILQNDKVDAYIVMGTVAGRFLFDHHSEKDVMVLACADPIAAGLTRTATERVRDNFFAHVDETRFVRQIQGAYRMLHFQKIGVVYEDSASAYSYSGIEPLEKSAERFGFEIVTRHVSEPKNEMDKIRYYRALQSAYSDLSDEVDALYLTTAAIEPDWLPELLAEPHRKGIATIAQSSEEQVAHGALLHVSMNNAEEEGVFAAHQFARYLDGTPLRELEQVFAGMPKISLNYETAKQVGREFPVSVLLVVDKIYGKKMDEE